MGNLPILLQGDVANCEAKKTLVSGNVTALLLTRGPGPGHCPGIVKSNLPLTNCIPSQAALVAFSRNISSWVKKILHEKFIFLMSLTIYTEPLKTHLTNSSDHKAHFPGKNKPKTFS